jgi:hypothetical protein
LLAGAGVADPLAQKAILLTSTRLGRATPQSAMGTQTGWQPDWGWGALDLEQALQVKTNFFTDDVEGDQVRFFRSTAQAAGERATLVWNRRNIGCIGAGCGDTNSQNFKLSNLDLIARDAATGQVVASSTSTIDNVEQVRSTASGDLVYVVRAVGPVEGPDPVDAEPFALAARRQVFPLEAPRPSVALGSTPAVVQPGVDVTVQATIANPSSDLTGENVQATLELPAGVQLAPGSAPATVALGTLSKDGTSGDEAVVTWIVRGTADGLHRLEIRATSTRYGETMSRDVARDLLVDGTAPELTLDVSAGGRDDAAIPVSWTAADAGLANTLLEVSTDNGAFAPWRTDPAGAATYPGEAGRTYVFRLVASDTAGNIASTTSGVVTVNRPVATVTPTATPTVPAEPRVPSGLRIRSTTFTRTRVTVSGSVSGGVTGTVRATFTARAGGRTRTVTRTATLRGRFFTLRLPLPRALRAARRGRITVSYAGPARYLPATATRTLRRR